jgi:hypothetical protein
MYSILSVLFSTALVGLVYGLSLVPFASLRPGDDLEDGIVLADQEASTRGEDSRGGAEERAP